MISFFQTRNELIYFSTCALLILFIAFDRITRKDVIKANFSLPEIPSKKVKIIRPDYLRQGLKGGTTTQNLTQVDEVDIVKDLPFLVDSNEIHAGKNFDPVIKENYESVVKKTKNVNNNNDNNMKNDLQSEKLEYSSTSKRIEQPLLLNRPDVRTKKAVEVIDTGAMLKIINCGPGLTGNQEVSKTVSSLGFTPSLQSRTRYLSPSLNSDLYTHGAVIQTIIKNCVKQDSNSPSCHKKRILSDIDNFVTQAAKSFKSIADVPSNFLCRAFLEKYPNLLMINSFAEPDDWAYNNVRYERNDVICKPKFWDEPELQHPFDYIGCINLAQDKISSVFTTYDKIGTTEDYSKISKAYHLMYKMNENLVSPNHLLRVSLTENMNITAPQEKVDEIAKTMNFDQKQVLVAFVIKDFLDGKVFVDDPKTHRKKQRKQEKKKRKTNFMMKIDYAAILGKKDESLKNFTDGSGISLKVINCGASGTDNEESARLLSYLGFSPSLSHRTSYSGPDLKQSIDLHGTHILATIRKCIKEKSTDFNCQNDKILNNIEKFISYVGENFVTAADMPTNLLCRGFVQKFPHLVLINTHKAVDKWINSRISMESGDFFCQPDFWSNQWLEHPFDLIGCLKIARGSIFNAFTTLDGISGDGFSVVEEAYKKMYKANQNLVKSTQQLQVTFPELIYENSTVSESDIKAIVNSVENFLQSQGLL